ncbi:MAG: hypothetical protein ACRDLL_09480 [Solirubrobacterales bacterium]
MSRAWVRPLAFAVVVLATLGPASSAADASGGTYTVVQCDPLNRVHPDAILEDSSPYAARSFCGDPHDGYAIKLASTGRAQHGGFGRVRWPTGSDDLSIVAVDVRAKLRRDNGHAARLWMADQKLNEVAGVASGHDGATAFRRYRWRASGRGSSQFVASLSCERPAGCHRSDTAKTWVRDVRLEVADYSDPRLTTFDGTVLRRRWLRGSKDLGVQAADAGGGISRIVIAVEGGELDRRMGVCDAVPDTALAVRFQPCVGEVSAGWEVDTARPPFHDGFNSMSACAVDFAGNRTCQTRAIRVDNTPPAITFAAAQDPDDPELIRAPVHDATSGVQDGEILYRPVGESTWRHLGTRLRNGALQARVDSIGNPPGRATSSSGSRRMSQGTSPGRRRGPTVAQWSSSSRSRRLPG